MNSIDLLLLLLDLVKLDFKLLKNLVGVDFDFTILELLDLIELVEGLINFLVPIKGEGEVGGVIFNSSIASNSSAYIEQIKRYKLSN